MTLTLDISGPRATLTLDRPDKRNALDLACWQALPNLIERAIVDPAVRLLVVTGSGGTFCAGADIDEFAAHAADPSWRGRNSAAIRAAQLALIRAPKPVVAAISGDAIGGGLGLALACDLRFAVPTARLGLTPAKLGLVYPLHDTKLLVDLVGPARAKRMLFTAEVMDAEAALRIGLVDEVGDDLSARIDAFADRLVGLSATTQVAAKHIVRRILDGTSDDDEATITAFNDAFTAPDFARGVAAFRARSSPPDAAPLVRTHRP